MARPYKNSACWFPHDAGSSRNSNTIEALENLYGNDGYAFWFKLLEILSSTDGLYIDCKDPAQWMRLLSRVRMEEEKANRCFDVLVTYGTISREYWENDRVVWCPELVRRLIERRQIRDNFPAPPPPCVKAKKPEKQGFETAESTFGEITVDPIIIAVQRELTGLTERQYGTLNDYRDILGDELILYAIDEAVGHGVRTWAYVEKILRGLVEKNIKTVGEAKAAREKQQKPDYDPDPVRWIG